MRTCYNCKEGEDTEVDMEKDLYQKIPMWYKKAGNYSLLPKSLNCKKKYNRNKTKFKKGTPKLGNEVKLDHKIKEKNTWIFYWASKPSNNHHKINDPETAYGNEKNSGLIKSDKKGKLTFILSCPQPYKIDEVTYPRHIHNTTLKKIKKKGACIECGENPVVRDLLYQYNAMDMILVRQYIEDHLTSHPKHEAITPEWCEKCKVLKGYKIKLKDEQNN